MHCLYSAKYTKWDFCFFYASKWSNSKLRPDYQEGQSCHWKCWFQFITGLLRTWQCWMLLCSLWWKYTDQKYEIRSGEVGYFLNECIFILKWYSLYLIYWNNELECFYLHMQISYVPLQGTCGVALQIDFLHYFILAICLCDFRFIWVFF